MAARRTRNRARTDENTMESDSEKNAAAAALQTLKTLANMDNEMRKLRSENRILESRWAGTLEGSMLQDAGNVTMDDIKTKAAGFVDKKLFLDGLKKLHRGESDLSNFEREQIQKIVFLSACQKEYAKENLLLAHYEEAAAESLKLLKANDAQDLERIRYRNQPIRNIPLLPKEQLQWIFGALLSNKNFDVDSDTLRSFLLKLQELHPAQDASAPEPDARTYTVTIKDSHWEEVHIEKVEFDSASDTFMYTVKTAEGALILCPESHLQRLTS